MAVMRIREMLMLMGQGLMTMRMVMFPSGDHMLTVIVLMVNIMGMLMIVFEGVMLVRMPVPLRQVQPYAQPHEQSGDQQTPAYRFTQEWNRHQRPEERGYRKVRTCSCRTQVA